jgi:SPP1 gp7 family putative phage head morphogenesis protein
MASTQALQARRNLVRSRTRKKPKKKPRRLREPRRFQLAYQRFFTAQRKALEELLQERLYPRLPELVGEAESDRRQDAARDIVAVIFDDLAVLLGNRFPEEDTEVLLHELAKKEDEFHSKEFTLQLKPLIGALALPLSDPWKKALFDNWIKDNLALIKSVQGRQLEELEVVVSSGLRRGIRVEDIRKELQQKIGISKSRAALIARDQTNKLYGEMTEHRQQGVGITEYDWDDSDDERVRPRHRVLGKPDNRRQKWAEPPIVDTKTGRRAHPGQDYQCRCQALPVIPDDIFD